MCHKCSLIWFNIGAEAEAGAGKHEGEGVLDLRLGGRIRSKEVSREISLLSRRELQVLMQRTAFMNLMFHTFLTSFFTVNLHLFPGLDLVSSTGIWAVNNPLIILVSPLPFLQQRNLQELSGWGQRSVLIPLSIDRVTPTSPHSISKDGETSVSHIKKENPVPSESRETIGESESPNSGSHYLWFLTPPIAPSYSRGSDSKHTVLGHGYLNHNYFNNYWWVRKSTTHGRQVLLNKCALASKMDREGPY